jgi:hypothetical protein
MGSVDSPHLRKPGFVSFIFSFRGPLAILSDRDIFSPVSSAHPLLFVGAKKGIPRFFFERISAQVLGSNIRPFYGFGCRSVDLQYFVLFLSLENDVGISFYVFCSGHGEV